MNRFRIQGRVSELRVRDVGSGDTKQKLIDMTVVCVDDGTKVGVPIWMDGRNENVEEVAQTVAAGDMVEVRGAAEVRQYKYKEDWRAELRITPVGLEVLEAGEGGVNADWGSDGQGG